MLFTSRLSTIQMKDFQLNRKIPLFQKPIQKGPKVNLHQRFLPNLSSIVNPIIKYKSFFISSSFRPAFLHSIHMSLLERSNRLSHR